MGEKFNLEEAINGRAFYLRNGYRGVIKYSVDDILTPEQTTHRFAYVGYILNKQGFLYLHRASWDKDGFASGLSQYDAVGMVEYAPYEKEQMEKNRMSAELLLSVEEVRKMWAQRYKDGLSLVNSKILGSGLTHRTVFISNEELSPTGLYYSDDMFLDKIREKGYTVTKVEPCRGEEGGIIIEGWA